MTQLDEVARQDPSMLPAPITPILMWILLVSKGAYSSRTILARLSRWMPCAELGGQDA